MDYRYAVYVTGGGTFKKIVNRKLNVSSGIKLCVSDSNRGMELASICKNKSIALFCCDFMSLPVDGKHQLFSDIMLGLLDAYKIDYCFSFGSHILKEPLIKKYYGRIINFHPGLLPDYKGLNAIDRAISNSEQFLGNTAHFIDAGVDTGEIIMQRKIPSEVYYQSGYDGVLDEQLLMIEEIVNAIESGNFKKHFGLKSI